MQTTVTMDKAGRMVLPKQLRDDLRLQPVTAPARLRKHRGVWTFSTGAPISLAETNQVTNSIRLGGRAVSDE